MNNICGSVVLAVVAAVGFARGETNGVLCPASVFGDRMVLQMERPIPVWGRAATNVTVDVSFAGQTVSSRTDAEGRWRVQLPPMSACREGRDLVIRSEGETACFQDVLVGEVWFACGQSNMECPIWGTNPHRRDEYGAVTAQTLRNRCVRFASTANYRWSAVPKDNFEKRVVWKTCTSEELLRWDNPREYGEFSAIAVYYALELYRALEVPIAIVAAYWGGTRIEPWIPKCGYESVVAVSSRLSSPIRDRQHPSALWNEQVSPWTPFQIRGMIWYQGCQNVDSPKSYCDLMHALYNGWSRSFENPSFKLYFVQLAPYRYDKGLAGKFPSLQEAQAKFAAEEPNAAMAVTVDVGNVEDCHPNRKLVVAKRLALHALKRDYGFTDIVSDSPVLKSWKTDGGKFLLEFDHAKGWFMYADDFSTDNGFEVAGEDGVWWSAVIGNQLVREKARYKSNGIMKGTVLEVFSPKVKAPVCLRYLHSEPWTGRLYNEVGLPLGPFHIGY